MDLMRPKACHLDPRLQRQSRGLAAPLEPPSCSCFIHSESLPLVRGGPGAGRAPCGPSTTPGPLVSLAALSWPVLPAARPPEALHWPHAPADIRSRRRAGSARLSAWRAQPQASTGTAARGPETEPLARNPKAYQPRFETLGTWVCVSERCEEPTPAAVGADACEGCGAAQQPGSTGGVS